MSTSFLRLGFSGLVTLSLAFSGIVIHGMDQADRKLSRASFAQPLTQASDSQTLESQASDQSQILRLTEEWFSSWSPGKGAIDWDKMGRFFAQSPEQLLVFDDAGGSVIVLNSWDEYRNTWEPFMTKFTQLGIEPEGEIRVLVDGNLATTAFTLSGGGIDHEGNSVDFRQRGTHVWRRINGHWMIVHEHLTTDS